MDLDSRGDGRFIRSGVGKREKDLRVEKCEPEAGREGRRKKEEGRKRKAKGESERRRMTLR